MNSRVTQAGIAALVLLILALGSRLYSAQPVIERFTAKTTNMDPPETLRIDVLRWSTEAEREQLIASSNKGSDEMLKALETAPADGYVWTDESVGYELHYAYRSAMKAGGERIVVATDKPLGVWQGTLWKPKAPSTDAKASFTFLELHVDKRGEGEGKMSLTAGVMADLREKAIVLANYARAPVLLTAVRRQPGAESDSGVDGR